MSKLTATEVDELVGAGVRTIGMQLKVIEVGDQQATLKLSYADHMVRPGGSIGGPVMMTLADAAIYAAILAEIGPQVMAMTTNLNINFLRRPTESDLTAKARILKLGQRLAIVAVDILDDSNALVGHVTGTYSLPPRSVEPGDDLSASSAKVDKALAALQLGETEATSGTGTAVDVVPEVELAEPPTEELTTRDLLALMDRAEE